jgi:hypothetical protein
MRDEIMLLHIQTLSRSGPLCHCLGKESHEFAIAIESDGYQRVSEISA